MASTQDVRSAFLDFFGENDHKIIKSSPLVPHNDPTLMFTNAGMVQFKNVFTGVESPPTPPRATSSQKCVRAGGKHNDLDNVGYTARHHTFFEMLGNFSFGDYFKEQAIVYAWEFLTKTLALPKDRLGVTVYHTDEEAFDLWKKISGLPDSKILKIPTKDNFWAMGDTGPCGPCSEVFYDHGENAAQGKWQLDKNGNDLFGDRFIEIWNLVFMQYEQVDADNRINLPKQSVDTGMGLERVAAILQNVHDNYDIDLFKHLIAISQDITGNNDDKLYASHKIIADHIRSTSFLIADGVNPSNEGRGYVLRRIMRRAMRHIHILGAKNITMHKLVPALVLEMGEAYPELKRAEATITETIKNEEARFRETLDRGLKLLEEEKSNLSGEKILSGKAAFKLYDTYGFPLDLTQDILRNDNIAVDTQEFEQSMAEQKSRARAAWKGSGDSKTQGIWIDILENNQPTEFLGYTSAKASAILLAIVKNGKLVKTAKTGDKVELLFNQTPAYAESGGQVGDIGVITKLGKTIGEFSDTSKPIDGLHVHHTKITAEKIAIGDEIDIEIDSQKRNLIKANHSATHLLHAVLRKQLGEHISQKGSLVDAEKLRFDISHNQAISAEQLSDIEREVNRLIWQNSMVETKVMKSEDAIKSGAMALFGEKYSDEVRVLSMGASDGDNSYSIELCGGTHVNRTGNIGLFKIISEAAIASGVRRIEALTNERAFEYLSTQDSICKNISAEFKITSNEILDRISTLQTSQKQLQKDLSAAKKQVAMGGDGASGGAEFEQINSINFLGKHFSEMPPKELRGIAEELLKKSNGNGIVVVTSDFEDKGSIVVAVEKTIIENAEFDIDAPKLVAIGVQQLGGKGGGGRPEMAQGGGANGKNGENAIAAIRNFLTKNS